MIDDRFSQISSFSKEHVIGKGYSSEEIEEKEIEIVSLDSLSFDNPIAFVKVDVEGLELEVLKGMMKTIKKHKPIMLLEYNGDQSERTTIINFVKGIEDYSLYYWDFFDMKFYKENRRGTINYFLLPSKMENDQCEKVLRGLIAE